MEAVKHRPWKISVHAKAKNSEMEAVRHQAWKISVHAKAKNFNFKFRASKILPSWRFYETRFTVLLKLQRFLLKVSAETGDDSARRRRILKSKFLRILGSFRAKRFKNEAVTGEKKSAVQHSEISFPAKHHRERVYEESISSLFAGNLALLSRSVSEKDQEGITIHTFTLLFYLVLLFKNFLSKNTNLSVIFVAFIACLIVFYLNYLNYMDHVSKDVWMAWNHTLSFGCLYVFTEVIFTRLSQIDGRKKLSGFFLAAFVSIVLFMLNRGAITLKGMEPYLVGKVFISCLTSFHVLGNPRDPKALAIFISMASLWVKEMASLFANY